MSRNSFISMAVIRRLPRYYRYLREMNDTGIKMISSRELADCMELTASQVRQDFNCFGDFGQQGCGYDIESLTASIAKILGLDENYRVVVMGAGRMGQTLMENFSFNRRGFELVAAFDTDRSKCGEVAGVPVYHVDSIGEFFASHPKADIGVLAVPADQARKGADYLTACGVKAIWNITKEELPIAEANGILVENLHISDSLMTLSYRLTEFENKLYGN
ncbi:MAG: redox-sensing transcriptional repressor Rex [Ruminococcaceae bacterium]|nr:redox-sensing transcriptional repressor Rex [Oscillospiraceae bacterium]MBQ8897070.1 redox-sensing transcriptional repressor Rex [Clostridia bacterium]